MSPPAPTRCPSRRRQFVTRHGEEVAVVLDIADYRRMSGADVDLKDYLRSAPDPDALEIVRPREPGRQVDLADQWALVRLG